ncbi:MAG: hypothetical protein ACFNM5_02325 [Candidatus Saccharibacteria bacterium]
MNANSVISDDMSLEEKLKAIDDLLNDEKAKEEFNRKHDRPLDAPVDPAELTACEGCQ